MEMLLLRQWGMAERRNHKMLRVNAAREIKLLVESHLRSQPSSQVLAELCAEYLDLVDLED
jgi:hypothetical protein